jgi:hypothetical protein
MPAPRVEHPLLEPAPPREDSIAEAHQLAAQILAQAAALPGNPLLSQVVRAIARLRRWHGLTPKDWAAPEAEEPEDPFSPDPDAAYSAL